MRALAHIEKLVKTYPIKNADNIEMVQLLDFHVVVKKSDNFKKDDLVLYVEIDSILPDGLPQELKPQLEQAKKELRHLTKKEKNATGNELKIIKEEILKTKENISEIVSHNIFPDFEFLRDKNFTVRALSYKKFLDINGNPIVSMGIVFNLSILSKFGDLINNSDGLFLRPFDERTKI